MEPHITVTLMQMSRQRKGELCVAHPLLLVHGVCELETTTFPQIIPTVTPYKFKMNLEVL